MGEAVRQLREALELRFPEAMPIARGLAPSVATGVPILDGALPNRGLPRGCLTLWRGGAASSALLRSACVQTLARGERAVWVDGVGAVLGDFWPRGVLVVRAGKSAGSGSRTRTGARTREMAALSAAEELLRSGGFALVVVTGVPAGVDAELVRLSRVAREGGGALVAVEAGGGGGGGGGRGRAVTASAARLKVESWYRADAHVWRRGVFGEPVEVAAMGVGARVMGTGWLRSVNFQLPVLDHAYRLSLDSGLVDRRGVRTVGGRPVQPSVQVGVQRVVQGGVESVGGSGLAGAREAGGVAAGGGAEAADRGARTGLGGRAWAGRASLRRGAARPSGGRRVV